MSPNHHPTRDAEADAIELMMHAMRNAIAADYKPREIVAEYAKPCPAFRVPAIFRPRKAKRPLKLMERRHKDKPRRAGASAPVGPVGRAA